jgi:hypothetical protein
VQKIKARSLLCDWAVKEVGIGMADLLKGLQLLLSGARLSLKRGKKIGKENGYELAKN